MRVFLDEGTAVEVHIVVCSKSVTENNTCVIKVYRTSCLFLFCSSLRAKYHKLKYGTELNQGDMKPPSYDSGKLGFIRVPRLSTDEALKAPDAILPV